MCSITVLLILWISQMQKNTRKMPQNYHLAFRTWVAAHQGSGTTLAVHMSYIHPFTFSTLMVFPSYSGWSCFIFFLGSHTSPPNPTPHHEPLRKKNCSTLVSLDPISCPFGIASSRFWRSLHVLSVSSSIPCCLGRLREAARP